MATWAVSLFPPPQLTALRASATSKADLFRREARKAFDGWQVGLHSILERIRFLTSGGVTPSLRLKAYCNKLIQFIAQSAPLVLCRAMGSLGPMRLRIGDSAFDKIRV